MNDADRDIPAENIRLLAAKETRFGAPKSNALLRKLGASYSANAISEWLGERGSLGWGDTPELERRLGLELGWLHEDMSFIYQLSPDAAKACRMFSALSKEKQTAVAVIIGLLLEEQLGE